MLQGPHTITVTVRSDDGSEFKVRVRDHVRLEHIFHAYAAAKGLDLKLLRFIHNGCLLIGQLECREIDMEPGDVIQVAFEQGGD